jgi:hypothetical protein
MSANLFGRHVAACPLDMPGLTTPQFGDPFSDFLRDGEVDELDLALTTDQKVVGLDIAMHITLTVHVKQTFDTFGNDFIQHVGNRLWSAS